MTQTKKPILSPFLSATGPSAFSSDSKFNGKNDKKQTTEAMPSIGAVPVCQTRTHKRVTKYVIKEEKK